MALSIKSEKVERAARLLAHSTGESITEAISVAVQERLQRLTSDDRIERRLRRLEAISADAAQRWTGPEASLDHGDLLYDADGLPA